MVTAAAMRPLLQRLERFVTLMFRTGKEQCADNQPFERDMWAMTQGARLLIQCAPTTTKWELTKFMLRSAIRPRLHRHWMHYLTADVERRAWLTVNPSLLWKLQRPYAMMSLRAPEKLQRLVDHYDWLSTLWQPEARTSLRREAPMVIASLSGASGTAYRVDIGFDERFAKEGELTLSMHHDHCRLATLVFSVSRLGPLRWAAHIGCLQGPEADGAGRDRVRDATKDLHGLRPKQAIVQAIYAIAHLHRVQEITGVSNAGHVYQARRRRNDRICADYDGFWAELGGVRRGALFVMPDRLHQKSIDEAPSRKRAQYRRRYELETSLAAQIDAVLAPPLKERHAA